MSLEGAFDFGFGPWLAVTDCCALMRAEVGRLDFFQPATKGHFTPSGLVQSQLMRAGHYCWFNFLRLLCNKGFWFGVFLVLCSPHPLFNLVHEKQSSRAKPAGSVSDMLQSFVLRTIARPVTPDRCARCSFATVATQHTSRILRFSRALGPSRTDMRVRVLW